MWTYDLLLHHALQPVRAYRFIPAFSVLSCFCYMNRKEIYNTACMVYTFRDIHMTSVPPAFWKASWE